MKIKELFNEKRPTISFEIFPPNKYYTLEKIYENIHEMAKLNPDFISVTYGAGGSTRGNTTKIASHIKNNYGIEALAHLTCLDATKPEIDSILKELKESNIENILALRGDIPQEGILKEGDFKYASDLVRHINKKEFSIGGAFYPEGHLESNDITDLFNLKKKVDSGTDFLISQIFFDNELFYKFKDRADKLNIDVPLVAGIIPVTNAKQIKRISSLCGCSLSPKFKRLLERYEHNPKALKEAGTAYAIEQMIDLISWGVDGIHLYTMNKACTTKKIMDSISHIRRDF